jgi:signal transduction histidine kinase
MDHCLMAEGVGALFFLPSTIITEQKMETLTTTKSHIDWLRRIYFSNTDKRVALESGACLLKPNQHNERLFFVLKGTLVGYIEDDLDERFEIFRSGEDKLVGAYSFFSKTHQSYSTVVAEGETIVAYIDKSDLEREDINYGEFAEHILPIVVEEIYMRQLLAIRVSMDRQNTIRKLNQAEKLAALGQMAAGLAHELNNAIGVIEKKSEWLVHRISEYVREKAKYGLYQYFEKGLNRGHGLSSKDVRQRKMELEKRYKIPPNQAKAIAKIGLSNQELDPFRGELDQYLQRINYYYETGLAIHDMLIAARHASEVVRSVQQLGTDTRVHLSTIDINHTIRTALSILEEMTHKVELDLDLTPLPDITAHANDWTQVWVNLIKNAIEALSNHGTEYPCIKIASFYKDKMVSVTVEDNGPGIPKSLRQKIFQPNVTTKVNGLTFGLGLGLSIVQRIVESYNGEISVESEEGKTTFTVNIPI